MEALKNQTQHPGFDNLVRPISIKKSKTSLYMISEYCEGGNLETYIRNHDGYLSEAESIKFMKGIIKGFKVLRDCNIIHRDIKPENVVLFQGTPKIADFGFSRFTEDSDELFMMVTTLGSPSYAAPQILKKQPYTVKCDIWSLGIMLYQMLYGKFPWSAKSLGELVMKIETHSFQVPQQPNIHTDTRDFLERALVPNEKNRMDWNEVFNHPLFADRSETFKKSLDEISSIDDQFQKNMAKSQIYSKEGAVIGNQEDVRDLAAKFSDTQTKRTSLTKWENTNDKMEIEPKNAKDEQDVYIHQQQILIKILKMRLCANRMAYERNKIFFINVLITDKLDKNLDKIDLNQNNPLFSRILLVLSKYLMIRIIGIHQIVLQKTNVLGLEQWEDFTQTQDYLEFQNLINMDYLIYSQFFKAVVSKCQEICYLSSTPIHTQPFLDILSEDIQENPQFNKVFNTVLYEFLGYIKPYIAQNSTDRQLLLLADYTFLLLRKLSEAFPLNQEMQFDFNKFYESKEKTDIRLILQNIKLKYKQFNL